MFVCGVRMRKCVQRGAVRVKDQLKMKRKKDAFLFPRIDSVIWRWERCLDSFRGNTVFRVVHLLSSETLVSTQRPQGNDARVLLKIPPSSAYLFVSFVIRNIAARVSTLRHDRKARKEEMVLRAKTKPCCPRGFPWLATLSQRTTIVAKYRTHELWCRNRRWQYAINTRTIV